MDEPALTLIIEWGDGFALREIMPARVLPTDGSKGTAAEEATREVAAIWGLPDFVFRPRQVRRGQASREVGDAILAVSNRAASIQVKSRAIPSSDDTRERRWLDKRIAEASRQAEGTIRAIRRAGGRPLTNERGRDIHLGTENWSWAKVVVLDHPGLDGYTPTDDAVVMLRRDWEFLFQQLKSTSAVLDYLHRVGSEQIELGTEPVRFYQYAVADADATPSPADDRLTKLGYGSQSSPLLPLEPAGHGDDAAHFVIRTILEDIAATRGKEPIDEQGRFDVLAAIDTVPVAYRAELGRHILAWMKEDANSPNGLRWHFRNLSIPGRPYLLFGSASEAHSDELGAMFRDYVTLRHQQQLDLAPERADTMTVGILLTPSRDEHRVWDTTMVATRGDQGYGPKAMHALGLVWGPLGTTTLGEPDWDAVAIAYQEATEEMAISG